MDIGSVVFDASKVLQTGEAFDGKWGFGTGKKTLTSFPQMYVGWLTLSPEGTGEIHIRVD